MAASFAVIFDMDGVLLDSVGGIRDSIDELLRIEKLPVSFSDNPQWHYRPLREVLAHLRQQYDVTWTPQEFLEKAAEFELTKLSIKAETTSGLLDFLNDLKSNSVPLAVGTASHKKRAEKIIKLLGIRSFFKTVVTSDDAPFLKGKAGIFEIAAQELGLSPNQCVVIDDAAYGLAAARTLGMKTIAFSHAYNGHEDLSRNNLVIENFMGLSAQKLSELF